jgi:uncharacterized protein (TIGR02678 family)
MSVLSELLRDRYIVKALDREKYYNAKDELATNADLREFLDEKLGFRVIVNPTLIKLEKIPDRAEPLLGILDFDSKLEYLMFCIMLIFLEEKNAGDQFLLTQLTDFMQVNYAKIIGEDIPEGLSDTLDWTKITDRRSFVKVMKFCAANFLVKVTDGMDEEFIRTSEIEVLYDSTGVSRYFARHFTTNVLGEIDILEIDKAVLEQDDDQYKGTRRRAYRKLLLTPSVTKDLETEPIFTYLRDNFSLVEDEFSKHLNCDLQVHKSIAMILEGDDPHFSRKFPENNHLSDITLGLFSLFREDAANGNLKPRLNEWISLSEEQFYDYVMRCKKKNGAFYGKTFRDKKDKDLVIELIRYMYSFGFAKPGGKGIMISPLAGKLNGKY